MIAQNSVVYTSPAGYNYTYVLPFEEGYLVPQNRLVIATWIKNNWSLSLIISAIYLAFIYIGKKYMKNRKGYELRTLFILWNIGLSIYSILGAVRSLPEFIYILREKGVKYSICSETYSYGITGYWLWLFILSKVFELFDTAFLILRKREVIFLHWYHHVTVLSFVWFSMRDFPATGRWFATINYSIHAIMYTYYAIATLRIIHIPKAISMTITSLQIVQMIVGVYVNFKVYLIKQEDSTCDVSYANIYASLIMYGSYFLLFFKFFLDKYFFGSSKAKNITKSKIVSHIKYD